MNIGKFKYIKAVVDSLNSSTYISYVGGNGIVVTQNGRNKMNSNNISVDIEMCQDHPAWWLALINVKYSILIPPVPAETSREDVEKFFTTQINDHPSGIDGWIIEKIPVDWVRTQMNECLKTTGADRHYPVGDGSRYYLTEGMMWVAIPTRWAFKDNCWTKFQYSYGIKDKQFILQLIDEPETLVVD